MINDFTGLLVWEGKGWHDLHQDESESKVSGWEMASLSGRLPSALDTSGGVQLVEWIFGVDDPQTCRADAEK